MVVAFHVSLASGSQRGFVGGELLGYLDAGVAIFFALSGFLLYRPLIAARAGGRGRPALSDYAKRRALRIFPAFAVAFGAYAIYPGIPGLAENWWVFAGLLQSFTFLYDPAAACGAIFCGFQHAWTITAELTFYALLPAYAALTALAFRAGGRRGWARAEIIAIVTVAAIGIATLAAFVSDPYEWTWLAISLPGVGVWFMAGIGLAVVSVMVEGSERERPLVRLLADRPLLPIAAAVAVVALLAALTLPSGQERSLAGAIGRYFAYGAAALLVIAPLAFAGVRSRTTLAHRFFEHPVMRWFGLVSYGVYLWHVLVVRLLLSDAEMFALFPGTGPLLLLLGAGIAGSVAAGAASYYVVERPLLRFKYRPLPWRRAAAAPVALDAQPVPEGEFVPESVKPPPGNRRFELVDSLRGLSALAIVLIHSTIAANAYSTTWIGRHVIGHLSVAVPMFLAISGFLLYRPFISWREGGPRIGLGGYGWRRFLRVVPGLWAAITLYGLIYLLIADGTRIGDLNIFSDHWWVYYGLLGGQTYLYDPGTLCGQNFCFFGPTWSLALEVMLYALVLPAYTIAITRLTARSGTGAWVRAEVIGLTLLAAVTLAGAAYYSAGHEDLVWLNFNPLSQALPFLCGMGLAVATVAIPLQDRRRLAARLGASAIWCVPTALILFAIVGATVPPFGSFLTVPERMIEYVLDALIVTLLLIPAVFRPRSGDGLWQRFLALPALAWIGVVSYGIFLWHTPFSQYLVDLGALGWIPGAGTYVLMALTFAAAIVAGAVSYYVIERPFLRLKRLTWRRQESDQAQERA